MKTSSLEILEKAELPAAQARSILKVMEQEMAASQSLLATKDDLAKLQSVMEQGFASLRAEMKALVGEAVTDIRVLQATTATKAELKGLEGTLSRWVLTCILAQTAVLAGAMYFVLSHLGR